MFKKFKESAYWKAALTLLGCGCLLIVFNSWISKAKIGMSLATINDVLFPFYIGIILSFLLCPLYNAIVRRSYARMVANGSKKGERMDLVVADKDGDGIISSDEKKRCLTIAKVIASVFCFVIVVGLITLLIYAVVPQVITSCVDLVATMPDRLSALSDWLAKNFSKFPILSSEVDKFADKGTVKIIEYINVHVLNNDTSTLIGNLSNGIVSAVNSLLDIIIGILIMVYVLNYKEKIFAICRKLVSATCKEKTKANISEFVGVLNDTFIGFIVGRVIDSAIIGLLTYVTLLIFGISFAPMISVIVGVTNVIPFFGPFIGAIPSFLILMLESPKEAFVFVIIILIIQQLDGNVIGPKCVGNAIGIDSFWVLVAVLIGGGLFGITGMIFGVPVFAVIYRYTEKLTVNSLRKQDKPIHTSDYLDLQKYGIEPEEIKTEKKAKKKKRMGFSLKKAEQKPEQKPEEQSE